VDLVNAYVCLRDNPNKVISLLRDFSNTEEEYYRIRQTNYAGKYQRAAKFIYLNKTSFNGIYRVNKKGVFNVPYGFRENIDLVEQENLIRVNKKLRDVEILHQDFSKIEDKIQRNDFVFLDPPYTVAH
jgi:DNA adenine methylase